LPERRRRELIRDLASAPGPSSRFEAIDAARFVAIWCVIFIHSIESSVLAPYGLVGTFPVPFYLFISLYLQFRSLGQKPGLDVCAYAARRTRRLYVPFLVWSAIYLVARNLKHVLLAHEGWVTPDYYHLWLGTAHHLYFLPMLLVVSVLATAVHRACGGSRVARWTVIVAALVAGVVLAVAPRPDWLNYARGEGYFFLQGWRCLPSMLLALGLAWGCASLGREVVVTGLVGLFGAALTVAMVGLQIRYGYSRAERTLSGLGWMLAALAAWRGPWVHWLARAGRHSYGMYLSHVLVIEGVQAVAHRAGLGSSVGLDVATIVCGGLGAWALAAGLGRYRRLAWLV
jgi:peptidoglycan/LPS O-acetylase OafA/YrhL